VSTLSAESAASRLRILSGSLLAVLTIFTPRIDAQSGTLTTLYTFTRGSDAGATLLQASTSARTACSTAVTYTGGYSTNALCTPNLCGTVFSLTPPADNYGETGNDAFHGL